MMMSAVMRMRRKGVSGIDGEGEGGTDEGDGDAGGAGKR